MLTSLVLTLTTPTPITLPRYLGRATHAALLGLITQRDEALATAMHDAPGPRPFTCSEIIGGQANDSYQVILPERPVWIRFTGLTEAVSQQLLAMAEQPPATVEFLGKRLAVIGATVDPSAHPWAGAERYDALCERILHRRGPTPRHISFYHASPTTFRHQGTNLPMPLPYLVVGSLLSRWQAFAPVAVSPDTLRYAEEMVVLSRYRLRTRLVRLEGRGPQVGFVGQSHLTLRNADRYWGNVLALLAAFSFYAGLGAHTTMGMGQTRPIDA